MGLALNVTQCLGSSRKTYQKLGFLSFWCSIRCWIGILLSESLNTNSVIFGLLNYLFFIHVELNIIDSYDRHGQNIKKTWYWWRDITFLPQVVTNLASTVNLYLSWRVTRVKLMGHWRPSWKFWSKSIVYSLTYFPSSLLHFCFQSFLPQSHC